MMPMTTSPVTSRGGNPSDGPSRAGLRGTVGGPQRQFFHSCMLAQYRARGIDAALRSYITNYRSTDGQRDARGPASTRPHKHVRTTRWHPRNFAAGHRLGARLVRHSECAKDLVATVASVYLHYLDCWMPLQRSWRESRTPSPYSRKDKSVSKKLPCYNDLALKWQSFRLKSIECVASCDEDSANKMQSQTQ